jgi:hypothetical protein
MEDGGMDTTVDNIGEKMLAKDKEMELVTPIKMHHRDMKPFRREKMQRQKSTSQLRGERGRTLHHGLHGDE